MERGDNMKNNLRLILATQKKTVKDLHLGTGLSITTLTALFYERIKEPKVTTLLRIAKYLGVSLDELIDNEEVTPWQP